MNTLLRIRRLPHGQGLPLPSPMSALAAGMDLYAALEHPVILRPLERVLVPTGLCMAIEEGFEGQVRPRSGLAIRHGLTCLNTPGTIDADYRGEVKVILVNLGSEPVTVERGMRIAQLVVAPCARVEVEEMEELPDTQRGSGGFGSTG